jgi:8-oxo-dGTP pyrophosphatase MutT (NUDIX family)
MIDRHTGPYFSHATSFVIFMLGSTLGVFCKPWAVCSATGPRQLSAFAIVQRRAFTDYVAKTKDLFKIAHPSIIAQTLPRHSFTGKSTLVCQRMSTKAQELQGQDVLLQDMLYRIRECNHVPEEAQGSLVNFQVDGRNVGKMGFSFAERLTLTPLFAFLDDHSSNMRTLALTGEAGSTEKDRTAVVQSLMKELAVEGIIKGWRDEFYPVISTFYDPNLPLLVERAAAPHFGIQQYGVHINGYVKDEVTGRPSKMWIARRSRSKSKYPGMLDHIVAGGQPNGMSPMENVIKECEEEAGIPLELASKARAAGAVSYEYYSQNARTGSENSGTMERCCLFCYDLELPPDFIPTAVDGEVEEFFLWDLDQVAETMRQDYKDPIKPNCYLVIIDFMLRWGYITPESPGYLDIVRELRNGQCS